MAHAENHLIEMLPQNDRLRLLAICEAVPLTVPEVLCEAGVSVRHVYFPTEGWVSQVVTLDGHAGVQVGMVGREGMLGAHLALAVPGAPMRALVQASGAAWRCEADAFSSALVASQALQNCVARYLHVLMVQLSTSAGCLGFHLLAPRLARWLLMCHDRRQADRFHATHGLLAQVLGVRRVGVTVAAGALQRAGLIAYRRGEVTVLDRRGLEAVACTCYAADCKAYATCMQ